MLFRSIELAARRRQQGEAFAAGMQQRGSDLPSGVTPPSSASGGSSAGASLARSDHDATTTAFDEETTAEAHASNAARVKQQMNATMGAIGSEARILAGQSGNVLRRETVLPGMAATGRLVLHAEDIKPGSTLVITATVGGDVHRFVFDAGETGK